MQPALSCGYQFEDDALVQEMVDEVVSERGALPLLAFAASRVWDARDREKGVLTRAAYHEIGGVAGALAQHAESTLERIGAERIPLVRELFRNLVTSQGTRAVRGRDDLLSVFAREAGEQGTRAAEAVLNTLVDARLLTTYERTGDAGERLQQIEIIHESLLTAWPRLVRWQTQDADGAQLRDQLRQAAQLWHDRGQAGRAAVVGRRLSGFRAVAGTLSRRPDGYGGGVCRGREAADRPTTQNPAARSRRAASRRWRSSRSTMARALAAERGRASARHGRDPARRGREAAGHRRAGAAPVPHRRACLHHEEPRAGRHGGSPAAGSASGAAEPGRPDRPRI